MIMIKRLLNKKYVTDGVKRVGACSICFLLLLVASCRNDATSGTSEDSSMIHGLVSEIERLRNDIEAMSDRSDDNYANLTKQMSEELSDMSDHLDKKISSALPPENVEDIKDVSKNEMSDESDDIDSAKTIESDVVGVFADKTNGAEEGVGSLNENEETADDSELNEDNFKFDPEAFVEFVIRDSSGGTNESATGSGDIVSNRKSETTETTSAMTEEEIRQLSQTYLAYLSQTDIEPDEASAKVDEFVKELLRIAVDGTEETGIPEDFQLSFNTDKNENVE